MKRLRSTVGRIAIAALAVAGWLAMGPGTARGQDLSNQVINGLEMPPADSLEWQLMDRLAANHKYAIGDLSRVARLTVLESIAMYENVRRDLRLTMIGDRVEGEISVLWDAAELFYVAVTPADVSALARARPLLADVEAAYDRLDATLGSMPAVSQLAAFHLRDIAGLLPVMNDLIDSMEIESGLRPQPAAPTLDVPAVREQARLLVEDLHDAARLLGDLKPAPAGRDGLIADLERLVDVVQGLDRLLAARAPIGEVVESLRLLRGRLWPVQARFVQTARTAELLGRWRRIRQRINAISDRFGRPRVIVDEAPAATTAETVDRRLLAQADRAIAALDEFMATPTAGGPEFRDALGQFRRGLFAFRQQVAAGAASGAVSRSLSEVVDANRRIDRRTRAESRIFRGGARIDPRGLDATTQAVEKLRALGDQSDNSPVNPDGSSVKTPETPSSLR